MIDFSSNVGPLRAPPKIIAALASGLSTSFAYPDPDSSQLRTAIAKNHRVGAKSVVVGNGATEIIYEYCRAFIRERMHVLVQAPTFAEYASAARLCGAKILTHHTMDIASNPSEFTSSIPRNGCVFVCNPNNPTGGLIGRKLVLEIAGEAAKKRSQLFVDECFIELCARNESVIRNVRSHDNLFVVRSFTKSFGIPGVRIGYGVGTERTAMAMTNAKVPWSVSGLAQSAGIAALGCKKHMTDAKNAVSQELGYLQSAINAIDGLKCAMPSMANFVLVKSSHYSAAQIRSRLLKKKILVRDCSSFDGLDSSFIRVAVRTRAQNRTLVRALESL